VWKLVSFDDWNESLGKTYLQTITQKGSSTWADQGEESREGTKWYLRHSFNLYLSALRVNRIERYGQVQVKAIHARCEENGRMDERTVSVS
jgi:hypothetical protein